MKLFAIIGLFCVGHLISCQSEVLENRVIITNEEPLIQAVDSAVSNELENNADVGCNNSQEIMISIQDLEKTYDFFELDYIFSPGGGVSGYYNNDTLVWLKSYHGGELGGIGADFYVKDGEAIVAVHQ